MTKTFLIATAMTLALGGGAFAMDMKCDDASMMKMQSDMDANAMATKDQKDMAMKEMTMAKDSMKANKLDDCAMHMDNAMKAVGGDSMMKGTMKKN